MTNLNIKRSGIYTFYLMFITFLIVVTITIELQNTSSNRTENVTESDTLTQLIESYSEYKETREHAQKMEDLLRGNIQDYCSDKGIYCDIDGTVEVQEIPTGALGLMDDICERGQIHGNTSPLCGDKELFAKLRNISHKKQVPFELMLGITMAESHIGANFTPAECASSNNWAGIKGMKFDDGSVDYGKFPTENGCRVYNFQSVEQFWYSFANSLKLGYIDKQCSTAECIAPHWVGTNDNTRRITVVNTFAKDFIAKK